VPETPAPRRSWWGYLAWAFTGLVAAVTLAHAVRRGERWGTAVGALIMFVAYGFLPRLQAASARAQARRQSQRDGTLTIDAWGVTRVAGDVREAVAWADLAWVRIYTTSAGPAAEDVFFALGAGNGKGCLVTQGMAVEAHLLQALQERLPGFDNEAVVTAMGSTTEAVFTVWTRRSDPARTTADEGARS